MEVRDESSFAHVLQDAVKKLEIPESEYLLYQLVDKSTQQILCHHCYVRDIFIFRKTAFPEVNKFKKLLLRKFQCYL